MLVSKNIFDSNLNRQHKPSCELYYNKLADFQLFSIKKECFKLYNNNNYQNKTNDDFIGLKMVFSLNSFCFRNKIRQYEKMLTCN